MQLQHLSHMTAMLETSASAMVNGRCQCCDESCLRYLTNQPARLSFPPQFVGCANKHACKALQPRTTSKAILHTLRRLRHADYGSPSVSRRERSANETSVTPQEIERRQQRQAEDGEMIRLDALEQMYAEALELIGADARRHRRAGRFEISIEKAIAQHSHGHARDLHCLVQH